LAQAILAQDFDYRQKHGLELVSVHLLCTSFQHLSMACVKLFFFALCCTQTSASAASEESCSALPTNGMQGQQVMLQHSDLRHAIASLHTQTHKDPPGYTLIGNGQCADASGNSVGKGWSSCTCGKPTGSICDTATCASVEVCAADCDAEPGCAAFSWNTGHCWLYADTISYVKINTAFEWYQCFAKAVASTTTSTTTTTTPCEPYSQLACWRATWALGANPGGSYQFTGDYGQKGCYLYSENVDDKSYAFYKLHGGRMVRPTYYGEGGTTAEISGGATPPQYRVPGYDCKPCEPYSLEACIRAVFSKNMHMGGKGYEFASFSHSQKGCYTYSSGDYAGYAYYGLGGSASENQAATVEPKTRPAGYDCVGL